MYHTAGAKRRRCEAFALCWQTAVADPACKMYAQINVYLSRHIACKQPRRGPSCQNVITRVSVERLSRAIGPSLCTIKCPLRPANASKGTTASTIHEGQRHSASYRNRIGQRFLAHNKSGYCSFYNMQRQPIATCSNSRQQMINNVHLCVPFSNFSSRPIMNLNELREQRMHYVWTFCRDKNIRSPSSCNTAGAAPQLFSPLYASLTMKLWLTSNSCECNSAICWRII
jgi:hypothetical protein